MKVNFNLLVLADCLFMYITEELLIKMDASKSLVPMEVGDIKKCIWVTHKNHYSFLNKKVDLIKVIGSIDSIELKNELILFRFVFTC